MKMFYDLEGKLSKNPKEVAYPFEVIKFIQIKTGLLALVEISDLLFVYEDLENDKHCWHRFSKNHLDAELYFDNRKKELFANT